MGAVPREPGRPPPADGQGGGFWGRVSEYCGNKVCRCPGSSSQRFRYALVYFFVPLYIAFFIFLAWGPQGQIAPMRGAQNKYLEKREYSYEHSDIYELPGFGFAFNGSVDMSVSALYPTLGASKVGSLTRVMLYLYICDYAMYMKEWTTALDGRRPARPQGRVDEKISLCGTDWYHYHQHCASFPLLPVNNSSSDLYEAEAVFSSNINTDPARKEARYYTALLMNCELKGYPLAKSRDCKLDADGKGENCTYVPPMSSEGIRIDLSYTYKNKPPLLYLSSVQEIFPFMYSLGALVWVVLSVLWVVNTWVYKNARGIDLQWHFSLFITFKPINFLYKLLFWEVVREGKANRHFYMVLTLTINCLYYCFLWETMMRVAHGWMIVRYRLTPQARFHLYVSLIIWAFGNFVFSYFYQFQEEGFGIVRTDLGQDIVAYYLVAFALLATGISYTVILMTVCLATSNLSHQMSDQINMLRGLGMNARGTFVANRKRAFQYMSVGFSSYLILSFITWFVIVAIEDSATLYPWLNDLVDECLESIFLLWVMWTFRARKFNNVSLQIEGTPAEDPTIDINQPITSSRICILNPSENNEFDGIERRISLGTPSRSSVSPLDGKKYQVEQKEAANEPPAP